MRPSQFVPDSSERSFPTSNKSFSFQIRSSMSPTRHLPPSLTATVSTFFLGAIFSSLKAEEAPGSLKSIKNAKEKTWSKRLYFERWAERAAQGHGAWARLRAFWRFFLFEREEKPRFEILNGRPSEYVSFSSSLRSFLRFSCYEFHRQIAEQLAGQDLASDFSEK